MNDRADTIRNYLRTGEATGKESAALDALLAEIEWGHAAAEREMRLAEKVDALEVENQRLRATITDINTYIEDLAYPGPEASWIADLLQPALAAVREEK